MNDYSGRIRADQWFVWPAPLKDAQALVATHHYARGGSNTGVYIHGLYSMTTGALHGVVWWLPPTRVACESVNREHWQKVLSLTRMVVIPDTPKNAASFLLAGSIKIIRREKRFVSLVTYADESQGHTGSVYRTAGWRYVGRTGPYPRWVDATGKQVARLSTRSRTAGQMAELGLVNEGSFHKHKFVKHLT